MRFATCSLAVVPNENLGASRICQFYIDTFRAVKLKFTQRQTNMVSVLAQAAWIPRLEQDVRRYLNGESSGHDPWHAFRVRDLALRIAQAIGADTEVVQAAALLHDMGHVFSRAEHAKRGASLAADLLSSCSFPADKVRAV